MSPRTALLAGLLLGVTVMIGVLGAIAWRAHMPDDTAPAPSSLSPTPATAAPLQAPSPSAAH
jgi:hypothetical protein